MKCVKYAVSLSIICVSSALVGDGGEPDLCHTYDMCNVTSNNIGVSAPSAVIGSGEPLTKRTTSYGYGMMAGLGCEGPTGGGQKDNTAFTKGYSEGDILKNRMSVDWVAMKCGDIRMRLGNGSDASGDGIGNKVRLPSNMKLGGGLPMCEHLSPEERRAGYACD